MTNVDMELDAFYLKQICVWLKKSEECDTEILFWENKRKTLRKT